MPFEQVRQRYPQAVEAVRSFLAQFYGAEIGQTEDPEEELMLFALGKEAKIVAVAADFLAGYNPVQIRENLAAWNVAHLSRTLERGCRLVITSDGPEEERD